MPGKIEKYEDLEVWNLSMQLCSEIYKLTNTDLFSKDFGLKDQIRRAAVSIPSNIAEGFERDAKKQFLYFLSVAKGSCGEVRTQLKISESLKYISTNEFAECNDRCLNVSKQLAGFIRYLKDYKIDQENNQ
ncbi:MAG TPA: four helix bundle protein [Niabella sp.]|nr:four helix bundle protein [Niabella sp.]HQW14592.1 four helix bundle protein [Niabella sp.]HQX19733.1 four helix bundle protein [Niabella sp.]HQX41692.1 four helix bundle protein [Niabella sp.]HRB07530.1 four helix bundle protein [Niabella sp.]